MLKNKKLMLALALPIVLFAGYTMTKHKPVPKEKVKGTIYLMPKEFLLNLRDGRYAKLAIALDLARARATARVRRRARRAQANRPSARCRRNRWCAKS